MFASLNGYIEIDVNIKNNLEETAFIFAVSNGHTEIVKLLLEQKGIDIHDKNNEGKTALSFASSNGYTEIINLLREKERSNVNTQKIGNATQIFASSNTEMVRLL